jgi:S-adenosyl methyltransferase
VSEYSSVRPVAGRVAQVSGLPRVAGIYDALLGGTGNRAADRDAARQLDQAVPGAARAARDNRAFLSRATEFLAGRAGIRQFLDIGAGPLTGTSVHKMAQTACPGAAVAYVDNDPLVVEDTRRRLAAARSVVAVEGDVRYPGDMLTMREVRDVIDFSRPVAVLLVAVLHFIPDSDRPWSAVRWITDYLAPGSYVAISHVTGDEISDEAIRQAEQIYSGALVRGAARSKSHTARFFDGLEMVPPGLVDVAEWRPGCRAAALGGPVLFWAGIACKPAGPAAGPAGTRDGAVVTDAEAGA